MFQILTQIFLTSHNHVNSGDGSKVRGKFHLFSHSNVEEHLILTLKNYQIGELPHTHTRKKTQQDLWRHPSQYAKECYT